MKAEDSIRPDPRDELAHRTAYLLAGYVQDTLTVQEHMELDDWINASMDNQRLFEELTDENNMERWRQWREKLPLPQALDRVKSKLHFTTPATRSFTGTWWRYAAAALLIGGILTTILLLQKKGGNQDLKTKGLVTMDDIAPGSNRAFLTLSNGSTIALDRAKRGSLAQQGNVAISKEDNGSISYALIDPHSRPATAAVFNTITTPKGGQYQLVLPDGTKVWLNAASSLRYPIRFADNQRKVELTGEGYFEVTRDIAHPFFVTANGATIQVLGTAFNIQAYAEEPILKVTLSSGAVRVLPTLLSGHETGKKLLPGQQAQVDRVGRINITAADTASDLAWKNGMFIFTHAPLEEILHQVARWYNADIIYQTHIKERFNATIPRSVPVSQVLHLLEGTDDVHFLIENNKITVLK